MFAVFCPIRDEACACKKRWARLKTVATLSEALAAQHHHLVHSQHHYMDDMAAHDVVEQDGSAWIEVLDDTPGGAPAPSSAMPSTRRSRSRSRQPTPSRQPGDTVVVSKDTLDNIMAALTRAEEKCRSAARISASASMTFKNEAESIKESHDQLETLVRR